MLVEKTKKIIIFFILITIIIIAICVIFLNNNRNKSNDVKVDDYGNYDESNIEPIINVGVEVVTNHSKFFAIADAIQKYYDFCSMNAEELNVDENPYDVAMAEVMGINNLNSKGKAIYSLLDVQYLKEKGITEENILNKVNSNSQSVQFYPLKMKYLDGTVNQRFAVVGRIRLSEDKTQSKIVSFIVTVGKDISTFMIKPLSAEYSDIENIVLDDYDEKIEKNNYNVLSYTTYKADKIAQKYFDYYKEIVHYDKKEIYSLMTEDYRNKRFGNEEIFEKYINNIEKNDETISAQEYLENDYDDYKEYICKDQYGNLYIFKEYAPMDITIELDTYTLDNETFDKKYKGSDTQYKVMMNIDKVRQMMNARDYRTMFNYLDETFRTTYFENNIEKFENYMRYYFPSHYTFEFGDYSEDAGISIQEVTMKDMSENSNGDIGERFYMQLNDGTDFVMSFNVIGK